MENYWIFFSIFSLIVVALAIAVRFGSDCQSTLTATQKLSTDRPAPSPSPPRQPVHRRLYTAVKWLGSTVLAVVAFLGPVYEIWGPIWPTHLVVELGAPNFSAFSTPIKISNKSLFFGDYDVRIGCTIVRMRVISGAAPVDIGQDTELFSVPYVAPQSDALPFTCRFGVGTRGMVNRFVFAKIAITVAYDHRYLFGFFRRSVDGWEFNWDPNANPPQWRQGTPLIGN